MTAVVYVGAGVSSITTPYIVQKQVAPVRSLRRKYTSETDVVLDWTTPSVPSAFKALANGTMSWVSSVLTRTASNALSWATSLTIQQNAPSDRALILKASLNSAKGNNIFEVQGPSLSTALASIDASGRIAGVNFRTGSGSPEGVVSADRGSIYLNDTLTDGNTALYVKTTDTVATGWVALGVFVPSAQAIPVGAVLSWPGAIGTDTVPVGYLWCDGSEQSTASYPALSAFCGVKFGSALAGNFKLPDYRGRTLHGVDNVLTFAPGINFGAAAVTLDTTQMPTHSHPVSDEIHDHPQAGPYVYRVDQAYRPPYRLPVNDGSGLGMAPEPDGFDHGRMTMMDAAATGDGLPFSTFQPTQSTNFVIKS
jgi:microcystin-dependent protein